MIAQAALYVGLALLAVGIGIPALAFILDLFRWADRRRSRGR